MEQRKRCPPLNPIPSVLPGEINQIFQKIEGIASGNRTEVEQTESSIYAAQIHSRPSNIKSVGLLHDKSMNPWVVTLDNFLTAQEADTLVRLGEESGFSPFEDSGTIKHSYEATWCAEASGCRENQVTKRILERMAKTVGLPRQNLEDLQLIKHNEGHYHDLHFEYEQAHKSKQCGPRVITFVLFLSNVEKGGEVKFPLLLEYPVIVSPLKGRALLWPTVLDSDPTIEDERLAHQNVKVENGTMLAAIARFHINDFMGPQKRGCV